MLLAEMLGYADIAQLMRIAEMYRLECDGHSKHELMQSILSAALEKNRFEELLDRLSLEDERFLHSLLFDDRDAFSLEELLARVRSSRFDAEAKPGSSEEVAAVRLEFESAAPSEAEIRGAGRTRTGRRFARVRTSRDDLAFQAVRVAVQWHEWHKPLSVPRAGRFEGAVPRRAGAAAGQAPRPYG